MRRLVSRLILTRQEHDKEKVSAYHKSPSLFECSICLQCIFIYVLVYLFDYLPVIYYFGLQKWYMYIERLRPEVQPLTLSYPFLTVLNGTPFWRDLSVKAIIWSATCPSGRPHPSNLLGILTICRRRWRMRGEVNTRFWSLLKDIPKFLFYWRFVLYM